MRSTAFHGPSIYSHRPVIRCTLGVASTRHLTPLPPSITERLFALLPGLREHRAPCDVAAVLEQGSGDTARLPIPHLFEHLCIELQNSTGADLGCVRTQGVRVPPDVALVPFDDEDVGLEAGNLSLALIEALSSAALPPAFERRLQAFFQFANRRGLPAQDLAIVRAAQARDIPVTRIVGRLLQLGQGCHQKRLNGMESTHTSVVSNDLAANKDYARRIFRTVGLPVPRYERVTRREEAVAAANRIGFPVVLKPNRGNMGEGVSVGLKTDHEVRAAFELTRELRGTVLIEEYVRGTDYRMLVIEGKFVAATQRIPAHVVGDGVHTIEELVRRANLDPRRGAGQRSPWTRLEFDGQSDRLLAELGYGRDSTPLDGQVVYLKRIANTSAGGTAIDVTDLVHPENREIAERAARTIGLDIAGVDLLVEDITQPMRAQGGVICEINSRPGIRKHLWPAEGRARDVTGPIMDMLFPPGSRSRIPIAVVTGLGDTRGVARRLADLLAADGSVVGLAVKDGVYIDRSRVGEGGMKGVSAIRLLLLDPVVEAAVIVAPPNEVLRDGLGYDWADACAVLNDRPIESSEVVEALRLVVGSARSHVVLSAEDEEKYGLKPRPEARVWRVSAEGRALAEGLAMTLASCMGRQPGDIERTLARRPVDVVP